MKKFLYIAAFLTPFLFVFCSSDDDDDDALNANIPCNSKYDCDRDSYCDLQNPQQNPELGTLVYYCKKRQSCIDQSGCPIGWRCKTDEGFCITKEEAEKVLCKSDADCPPMLPKCNLATGECYNPNDEGGDSGSDSGDSGSDSGDSGNSGNSGSDSDNSGDDSNADSGDDSDVDSDDSGESAGAVLLSQDFEDNGAKWEIISSSETPCWEIGTPSSGPAAARSGTIAAATILAGDYLNNCRDVLYYVDSLSIPSSGNPKIEFYAWVKAVGTGYVPYDYMEVLLKQEEEIWESLSGLYLSAGTPSPLDALDNAKTKITKELGTSYYKFSGDLSAFKGKTVQIGFRFVSDENDVSDGIYLDDVSVSY